MNLVDIPQGVCAKVICIEGGHGCREKIQNLGIREGKNIKKITAALSRGPVVVKVGSTQIAIGRGMASSVIVELIQEGIRKKDEG